MNIKKLTGLISAPYTPMYSNGSIKTEIIPEYSRKLKEYKLSGVFVNGTTGEGLSLTTEERIETAKKWIAEQTDNFKVIIHVGSTSLNTSKKLAAHAQKHGAYATGCMGPMFLPPADADNLITFCAEVASCAPNIPFYYYHIPKVSGVKVSMTEFLKKAPKQIPNLAGIKYSGDDFLEMMECIELDNNKWDILHGYDELLLAGLALGIKGAVGSTYNYMPQLYYDIIENFENGNIETARKKQLTSVRTVEILNSYGGPISAGKTLMKHIGIDCGPSRLPLNSLNNTKFKNMIKEIENLAVLNPVYSLG